MLAAVATSMAETSPVSLRAAIVNAIGAARYEEAEKLCADLEAQGPGLPDAWVFRARIAQNKGDYPSAAQASARAISLAPDQIDVKLVHVESLMFSGDVAGALAQLDMAAHDPSAKVDDVKRICVLYTQFGRHHAAYRAAQRAHDLSNGDVRTLHLLGSAAIAVGKHEEAENHFNGVIASDVDDVDIYYNRATLRRQTREDNHVKEIMQALLALPKSDPRETPLCYALGKEFEDLNDHSKAFAAFAQGAAARRRTLSYTVETDRQAIDAIIDTFSQEWAANAGPGFDGQGPIFILGLPRSGTTLVDRIISAHSQVTSLEEVHDFAYAVIRAGYPAATKQELMQRVSRADFATLGREYAAALDGYGEPGPHFIDKTPANFLYLGLIAKALPNAKIIHLRRHPLASCYAMFKTLFRMGYPFSYDLQDVAHYYCAYDTLMAHWHDVFPGRIFDVHYEALVDDQESVSRKIIDHCGLDWEAACLDFHKTAAPSATASAAQVRQPLYTSARDLWRQHAVRLAPARQILEEGGISCD